MIKINLLAGEHRAAKAKKTALLATHSITVAGVAILIVSGLLVGWRYMTLTRESQAIDQQIADAQRETARLHSIIVQVQQFEQQKAQLQQRVSLIEQLREEQIGPVHMLDQISRALPPMLWLTSLKQGDKASEVLIDGECPSQSTVSDFVANLEATGYFEKSIDIVSTSTEPGKGTQGELVKFSLHAVFQQPRVSKAGPAGTAATKAGN